MPQLCSPPMSLGPSLAGVCRGLAHKSSLRLVCHRPSRSLRHAQLWQGIPRAAHRAEPTALGRIVQKYARRELTGRPQAHLSGMPGASRRARPSAPSSTCACAAQVCTSMPQRNFAVGQIRGVPEGYERSACRARPSAECTSVRQRDFTGGQKTCTLSQLVPEQLKISFSPFPPRTLSDAQDPITGQGRTDHRPTSCTCALAAEDPFPASRLCTLSDAQDPSASESVQRHPVPQGIVVCGQLGGAHVCVSPVLCAPPGHSLGGLRMLERIACAWGLPGYPQRGEGGRGFAAADVGQ